MWRRNQVCSLVLFALGLGILIGSCIQSSLLAFLLAFSFFALGFFLLRRRI
ncbi:MAG: hypothetical protein ACI3V3_02050 [Faecousia sp.]